ncbi:MAG: OmpA family protein [Burkholderiaceae bacterium]|nr:OmpA family protein [Burkholderiaceae bacterium]
MCRVFSARARFALAAKAGRALGVLLVVLVAACAKPDVAPTVAAPPPVVAQAPVEIPKAEPAAPRPVLPFDEAVLDAANQLLGTAKLPPAAGGERWPLTVDPFVDGLTGVQSNATQALAARTMRLIREDHAQFEALPFNGTTVGRSPWVLIGTLTGVNAERKAEGRRETYRICLMPLPFYRDAPVLAEDAATQGYVESCQGMNPGDPVHPAYIDRILVAATLAEAADAYGAGQHAAALKLFEAAERMPGGGQLRTYTGLYLTQWRLGRRDAAGQAFARIVDQGLDGKRLGVKFLFRPGTATLWSDPGAGPPLPYSNWIAAMASSAAKRNGCLLVVGHASPTGSEAVNNRLSLMRAKAIESQLVQKSPALAKRITAIGAGSRETVVGNGRDDASDALDRRVELKIVDC